MKLGKSSIHDLIEKITEEKKQSRDFLVPTQELQLQASVGTSPMLVMKNRGAIETFGINGNAHRQIADHLGIPFKYYEKMRTMYPELLAENVNGWFHKEPKERMLRTMAGTARAFLSNKYRRIDNLELMQAIYPVLQGMEGVSVKSCEVTEDHLYLQVVTDKVQFEIAKGDIVQAGFIVSNSEVGQGAVSVQPLVYRLVCTNGMIGETAHRRYHTGKRVETDDNYELFQDNTKILDNMTYFAKVQDIVRAAVDETKFNQQVIAMQQALGVKINPMTITPVVEELGKTYALTRPEQEQVVQNFLVGDTGLDGGHLANFNQFGLANAVTRVANSAPDYERAVELERIGGSVMFADLSSMLADNKSLVA